MADHPDNFETPAYKGTPRHTDELERSKPRSRGLVITLLVLILAVVVVLGFFASHAGMDRKTVEARLKEWSQYAGQVAQAEGYTLTLNYTDIQIEGHLFAKQAHIISPIITLSPIGSTAPEQSRTLATDGIYLVPGMIGSNELKMRINDRIYYTDAKGRTRVTAGEPLEWLVEQYSNEKGSGLAYAFILPPHVLFERLGRQSETIISSTDIGFGDKSKINGKIDNVGETYMQDASINNLSVRRNGHEWSAAGVTSQFETANENGSLLTHYNTHVDKLTGNGALQSIGPVDADAEVELTEPLPADGQAINLTLARERNIVIDKLLFSLPSAKILTTGNLRMTPGELVPFGTAAVEVDHPDQLINAVEKTNLLHGVSKGLVTTMIQKVEPDWKGGDTPVRIDLKRQPDAPFYLGALTFENFTAQLLSQLIQQSTGDMPTLPGIMGHPASPGAVVVPPAGGLPQVVPAPTTVPGAMPSGTPPVAPAPVSSAPAKKAVENVTLSDPLPAPLEKPAPAAPLNTMAAPVTEPAAPAASATPSVVTPAPATSPQDTSKPATNAAPGAPSASY